VSQVLIDKELAFVALQRSDLGAKMRAICEYNRLHNRIANKIEEDSEESPIVRLLRQIDGKTRDLVKNK